MDCPICEEDLGADATPADLIRHTEDEHVLSDAQRMFGGRCEDYPCCGHGENDCPVYSDESGYLPYPCLSCGKRIRSGSEDDAGSRFCSGCISSRRFACTCGDEDEGPCDYHDRLAERDEDLDENEESEG